MLHILGVSFPFFALVACGYAATRMRWVPLESIPGLNVFVLYFALPCLLYRFSAATPIARMLDPGVVLTYLLCGLAMVAITIVTTRRGRIGWNDAAFGALVAAFPNSGFMGVPLIVALLGERAVAPSVVALSVDMVVTSSLCIALSRLDDRASHGARRAALQALRGIAINPLPWAIVLGCISSAVGAAWVPAPVMKVVGMLADSASPVALFTLGCVLARSQVAARRAHAAAADSGAADDALRVVGYKLVLHPLLVLLAGRAAILIGVPLDRFAGSVLVLVAALPSASNVVMLAERFDADAGRIARIVLVSTAFAFLTFSAAAALLGAMASF